MNAIGAISAISGVSGISGISGVSGVSGATATSPISCAGMANGAGAVDGSAAGTQAPGDSFLNSLSDAFGSLNGQLNSADASMANFASGGSADLHTVMLQMEEASVGLKSAVDVRDKLLEAYQEIMRTQL
jgi:flagellar hook-basal body complex protein FliE